MKKLIYILLAIPCIVGILAFQSLDFNSEKWPTNFPVHEYYVSRGFAGPSLDMVYHFTRNYNVLIDVMEIEGVVDSGMKIGTWFVSNDTLFIKRDSTIKSDSFSNLLFKSSDILPLRIMDYGTHLSNLSTPLIDMHYSPKNAFVNKKSRVSNYAFAYYRDDWTPVSAKDYIKPGAYTVTNRVTSGGKTLICTLSNNIVNVDVANPLYYRFGKRGLYSVVDESVLSEWMDTVTIGQTYNFEIRWPLYPVQRLPNEVFNKARRDTIYISRGDTLREAYGYFFARIIPDSINRQ